MYFSSNNVDDIYIYKKIIYMNAINSRVIICTGLLCTKIFFSKINSSPYIPSSSNLQNLLNYILKGILQMSQ